MDSSGAVFGAQTVDIPDFDALLIESIGAPMVRKTAGDLVLPERPVPFDGLPERMLLILFASRAGSTYAARLLAKTPHFNEVREAFNVRPLSRRRLEEGLADDAEAARRSVAAFATGDAFAAKCGVPGLIGAHLTGFLTASWSRLSLVMLKRRDVLAQAVSIYRAQLSGQFHSPQRIQYEVKEADYDRANIARFIKVIERAYEQLERFVELGGKRAPVFYYEDICDDPRAFVEMVCSYIDLPAPTEFDPKVNVKILRDDINKAWIERFRAGL